MSVDETNQHQLITDWTCGWGKAKTLLKNIFKQERKWGKRNEEGKASGQRAQEKKNTKDEENENSCLLLNVSR